MTFSEQCSFVLSISCYAIPKRVIVQKNSTTVVIFVYGDGATLQHSDDHAANKPNA